MLNLHGWSQPQFSQCYCYMQKTQSVQLNDHESHTCSIQFKDTDKIRSTPMPFGKILQGDPIHSRLKDYKLYTVEVLSVVPPQ